MKKVLVIGAGRVGAAIAADLSTKHEVTLCDVDGKRLEFLRETKFDWASHDGIKLVRLEFAENIEPAGPGEYWWLSDTAVLKIPVGLLDDKDIVVSAVPGRIGFQVLKKIIESGKNVVDISFFPEDPMRLNELAKEKNAFAVVDCGVAPGLDNMILGNMVWEMDIKDFECLVGGLPKERNFPFEYKAPFSPADVIEEYIRPARLWENGSLVVKEALSECELVHFDGIGSLEAFNTDGLRTLLNVGNIPNMREKTLRYPGHAQMIKALKAAGFFKEENLANTVKVLFENWKLNPGEKELTAFRVTVKGFHFQELTDKTVVYQFVDTTGLDGTSSMARTTGYTASAVVNLALDGKLEGMTGIVPPEEIGKARGLFDYVMRYLFNRDIRIERIDK
jgi:saccharopine dehydrogenase-like NADP-dependent oxidoreductase